MNLADKVRYIVTDADGEQKIVGKALALDQPEPKQNEHPAAWDLVIADMRERDRVGLERYGTRLQPFNSRNTLRDAYAEILDLAVYMRSAIAEAEVNAERVRHALDALEHGYPEAAKHHLRAISGTVGRVSWPVSDAGGGL